MFTLGMEGNSGCDIKLIQHQGKLAVSKSTADKNYIPRLKRQVLKQQQFFSTRLFNNIAVPEVLEIEESCDQYHFIMNFIHGAGFNDIALISGKSVIDQIIDGLKQVLEFEISQSKLQTIPSKQFNDKVTDVLSNTQHLISQGAFTPATLNAFERVQQESQFDRTIPVGRCHGDLTLSNLIYSKRNSTLYFIDFLDPFIETPLMDICKIRQDTRLGWSFTKSQSSASSRMRHVLAYIDTQLTPYIDQFDWVKQHYRFFQDLNILRIAPYAKSDSVIAFINTYFGEHHD